MATYHILLDTFSYPKNEPVTDCHVEGCNVYAHVMCIRCLEHFCSNHSLGTLKTVSYGVAYIPLCLNCITPQEQEANKTNTAT